MADAFHSFPEAHPLFLLTLALIFYTQSICFLGIVYAILLAFLTASPLVFYIYIYVCVCVCMKIQLLSQAYNATLFTSC